MYLSPGKCALTTGPPRAQRSRLYRGEEVGNARGTTGDCKSPTHTDPASAAAVPRDVWPRHTPARAPCRPAGILHSSHIQPRLRSVLALSASNLCSERAPAARPGSRTSEQNPLPALPYSPPAPDNGLRHWSAAKDRFFSSGGSGGGATTQLSTGGGGLLGEIAALRNGDAPDRWGRPSLSVQVGPFPDASWEV